MRGGSPRVYWRREGCYLARAFGERKWHMDIRVRYMRRTSGASDSSAIHQRFGGADETVRP